MKKLKLNKQTIANLDNPNKILGGGVAETWSLYNGHPYTCHNEKTCEGYSCPVDPKIACLSDPQS